MSRQFWKELLTWVTADGTPVANTVSETIIFPDITIPANYMADGRVLRLTARGKLSTTGTPTLIFRLRWGGVAGTLLALSETLTMGSGVTDVNWEIELDIQTRVNGATGSLLVMGRLIVHTASGTVLTNIMGVSGFDAPAPVTVDLTADTALSLSAQWGTASASNTLTGMQQLLTSMN